MNDEHDAPPQPASKRAAVARLTEALAAAQAAARAGASELGDDAASGTAVVADVDHTSAESDGSDLRTRIDALEPVGDDAEPPADADTATRPDEVEPGAPSRRMWPLYGAMALLVLAVPVLAYVGYRLASDSTAGEVLGGRGQPDAPGYTALVEPTPAALVMVVTEAGHAQSLGILSLSGPDQQGGVMLASPVDVHMSKPRLGITTFAGIIDVNSPETGARVIGEELGLGFTEVIEVTLTQLSALIEPVEPLVVDNPEAVTRLDGQVIEPGRVELDADEVPAYLMAQDAGHTVSGHLARQRLVWEAWIAAIAASDSPTAIPGETDTGLGRYLSGLAAGEVQSASIPVTSTEADDGTTELRIDEDPTMLLIANAVPFPVGAVPGARATVALLNGTGPEPAPASVIQRLTYAGAQITTLGNADHFEHDETTLVYSGTQFRSFAVAMADQLGVGRVVATDSADESVDVAIVLGADLMDDPPGPLTREEIESDP